MSASVRFVAWLFAVERSAKRFCVVNDGADIGTCQDKSAGIFMIGDRLKEERERIGLTQPQFADAAGAAKRTLIEWEKGATSPSAVQLSALSAIGVDVLYVVTGKRAGSTESGASRAEIDSRLMARIYDMLDRVAKAAGKRWTDKARMDCAVRVYNFLVREETPVTEERIERVLRLVVNG